MEPVKFTVQLHDDADVGVAISALEAMATDVQLQEEKFKRLKQKQLLGETSQATYERIFQTKLEYRRDWTEISSPQIPDHLKSCVRGIYLDSVRQVHES